MFCQRCGKKLEEGEVCSCVINLVRNEQGVVNAETPPPTQSENALPDSKVLADAAKNAAQTIKNNFIVNEIFKSFKDALVSPVRLVHNSAKRTDILWLILFVIDSLVIALCSNIIFEVAVFSICNVLEITTDFEEFKSGLEELGYKSGELFSMNLMTVSLCMIVVLILIVMILVIGKKNVNIGATANAVMGYTICRCSR